MSTEEGIIQQHENFGGSDKYLCNIIRERPLTIFNENEINEDDIEENNDNNNQEDQMQIDHITNNENDGHIIHNYHIQNLDALV
ncbi:11888_t:CDS:2 [Entrophospora sp. SA101]|nr:11888_t:CDS:2 [Entrophospora sp. SA101]